MSLRRLRPRLLVVPVAVMAVVGAAFLAVEAVGVSLPWVVRDPLRVADADAYWWGALSQIMLFAWAGTAWMLAAAAVIAWDAGLPRERVLASAAGASLFLSLGLDDALLFHEKLAERYLGIDEAVVTTTWVLVILAWVACFRAVLGRGQWELLVTAGALFAGSVSLDAYSHGTSNPLDAIEEWLKYTALTTLVLWAVSECRATVREGVLSSPRDNLPAPPGSHRSRSSPLRRSRERSSPPRGSA